MNPKKKTSSFSHLCLGLCELEKYLPEFIKNPTVKVPVKNKRGGASSGGGAGGYQKRADRRDTQLADLYDKMKQV